MTCAQGGVLEALARLPGAGDVPAYRAATLAATGRLGRSMRQAERMLALGELEADSLAELWTWCAYLEHVRGFRARTTVDLYLRGMTRLLAWARGQGLDYASLTRAEFDAWHRYLAIALNHSAHYRSRQVYAVRSFFEWRESRGIGRNVARELSAPRQPIGMPRKYSMPQLQAMCRAAAEAGNRRQQFRDVAMLLFLYATGGRREEVVNVSLGDLHLGSRTGLVRFHGKGSKEREVSFEGPVVDALHAWLLERELIEDRDPDALFLALSRNGNGSPEGRHRLSVQAVDRIIARHAKAAGLKEYGVHRFRVTFATTLYDDGNDIEEIRIALGHSKIETTRRYLDVSERRRRTRMRADRQHEMLGTKHTGQPRWLRNALGGKGA